jgi:MoaA/NifB/PqqE/SkfB family radical SAM enzyme
MIIKQFLTAAKEVLAVNFSSARRFPLSVYLSVTDRCPHACEYCNIPNRKLKEMSTEQVLDLIRQLKECGAVRLQLVGGEPLMRDDIARIINFAKEEGIYVTMSSTGFPADRINLLKNIDMVFLSFDGSKEAHDYHKGKGAYDNLMEAIGILKDLKIKFLTTTVLTRINKDCVDFILQTAPDKGFMTVFQPLYYTSISYKNHFHLARVADKYILTNEEMRELFQKLILSKKRGAPILSSLPYLEYMAGWKDYQKIYSTDRHPRIKCWAGRLYCYLDTDGQLYPCGDSIGVVAGRDSLQEGFREAFANLNLNHGCQSCIIACDLEKNLLFSLNVGAIMNWLRFIF